MSKRLTVDLEDNEFLALEHFLPDPREWLVEFVSERASNHASELLELSTKHPQFAALIAQRNIDPSDHAALYDAAVEFITSQPGYENAAARRAKEQHEVATQRAARDALVEERRLDRERFEEQTRLEIERAEAREAQRLELIARVAELEKRVPA